VASGQHRGELYHKL